MAKQFIIAGECQNSFLVVGWSVELSRVCADDFFGTLSCCTKANLQGECWMLSRYYIILLPTCSLCFPASFSPLATAMEEVFGEYILNMSKENLKKILYRKKLPPKWNFKFKKAASSINVQISDEQLESIN